jgi:UrcA family protein
MYSRLIPLGASIAITAIGLAIIAAPALGAPPMSSATSGDDMAVHVSYADLDLTSVGGETALRARVETAVRHHCAGMASLETFAEANCRRASRKDVNPQIASAVQRARKRAASETSQIGQITVALPK